MSLNTGTMFLVVFSHILCPSLCTCMKPVLVENLHWTKCVLRVAREHFQDGGMLSLTYFRHKSELSADNNKPPAATQYIGGLAEGLHLSSRWSLFIVNERTVCQQNEKMDKILKYNSDHQVQRIFLGNAKLVLDCVSKIPPVLVKHNCLISADMEGKNFTTYNATIQMILEVIRKRQLNCKLVVTSEDRTMSVYTLFYLETGIVPLLSDTCHNGTLRKNVFISAQNPLQYRVGARKLRCAGIEVPPMLCKTEYGNFEGVELEPFKILMNYYNFSLEFLNVTPPEDHSLNPWGYALLLIDGGEADLTLGRFIAMEDRIYKFRHSYPIYLDSIVWFVTKDHFYTSKAFSQILFTEFSIIYITTACAMHLISWSADLGMRKDKSSTLLMVWAVFTEQPTQSVNQLTKKQKAVWVLTALVALNVNVLRKSFKVATLNNMVYAQNISTLSDLIESDIPIVYDVPENLFGLKDEEFRRISWRLKTCPDFPMCLERLNISGPFAAVLLKTTMDYAKILSPEAMQSMVILHSAISGIHINAYSRWNIPVFDAFENLMARIQDVGLVNYWRKTIVRRCLCKWSIFDSKEAHCAHVVHPTLNNDDEMTRDYWVRSISRDYLLSAVKVLLFGYFSASFILLLEIGYYVATKRCSNLKALIFQ